MLKVDRTSFYRPAKIRNNTDKISIEQLLAVHHQHPFYGVRRLAIHLGWSQNKTRRIRTLAGVSVPSASKRHKYPRSNKAEISTPQNILHSYAKFKDVSRPQDGMDYSAMVNAEAWVQDFTYLKHNNTFCYLAVVLSLKTRQIVGWRLGTNHTSELTHSALLDALSKHASPAILHSDQGSEYLSFKHKDLCNKMEIQLSADNKASPWQNGFMERWFGNFKLEFYKKQKFKELAQLHEAIALYIHYYNTKRIHTALKMSPVAYATSLMGTNSSRDKVLQKKVA